jgi:hypothetical protein
VCALKLQNLQLVGLRVQMVQRVQLGTEEQLTQRSLMYQHHGAQLILPLCGEQGALVLSNLRESER